MGLSNIYSSSLFSSYHKNQRYAMAVCALRSVLRGDGVPSRCCTADFIAYRRPFAAGQRGGRGSSDAYFANWNSQRTTPYTTLAEMP